MVAGALGHRHALFGYSGHVPERLAPGDTVHLLNMGGVLGICDSVNPDKGQPFDCEVLGAALHFPYLGERIGVAGADRRRARSTPRRRLDTAGRAGGRAGRLVHGSCGKTAAACTLVRASAIGGLTVDGLQGDRRLAAARHAGDGGRRRAADGALHRPRRRLDDAGQRRRRSPARCSPALAAGRPDVIVAELGDGLLGTYGVEAILE